MTIKCPTCNGYGDRLFLPCITCGGTGSIECSSGAVVVNLDEDDPPEEFTSHGVIDPDED